MNITDLEKKLSEKTGVKRSDVKKVLKEIPDELRESLLYGQEIYLTNFGVFRLNIRKPVRFGHPQTGEVLTSKKKYVLKFDVFKKMKDSLENKVVYD